MLINGKIVGISEIFPKHNGDAFISESFALNLNVLWY